MKMNRTTPQEVAKRAGELFGKDYHCVEAVAKAVLESLGEDAGESVACATAFGGGFGRCHQETCGALCGALIAIGHLHGRREPGQNWDQAADLAATARKTFIQRHGTTHCQTLRDRFGEQEQMDECHNIVRLTTHNLIELLDGTEKNDGQACHACSC
ncbi:MAG: C-GCAxxG-C-C family protein [Proteobacteria bacterium]|nr:C-GCAxxG-C-C family protein [Pseudomonadota bacterium]